MRKFNHVLREKQEEAKKASEVKGLFEFKKVYSALLEKYNVSEFKVLAPVKKDSFLRELNNYWSEEEGISKSGFKFISTREETINENSSSDQKKTYLENKTKRVISETLRQSELKWRIFGVIDEMYKGVGANKLSQVLPEAEIVEIIKSSLIESMRGFVKEIRSGVQGDKESLYEAIKTSEFEGENSPGENKWFTTYAPNAKYTIDKDLNIRVEGNLDLQETQATKLPDNLIVEGNLDLRESRIRKLPERLSVGGWIDLSGTPIRELPEGLSVGGDLYLQETGIRELPKDLKVGGNLYLSRTKITELPEGLRVGGSLYLQETGIRELPKDLKVGGNLNLHGTPIRELPKDLKVGGEIYKD